MFTSVSKAQSRGPTWQALWFFLASIANFVVTRQTDTEVGEEGGEKRDGGGIAGVRRRGDRRCL
jgi:hypothetical protein